MRRIRLTLVGLMICAVAQASSPERLHNVDSLVYLQRESFIVWYAPAVNVPALVAWSLSGSDLGRCRRPAGQNFLTDFDCPKPRAKSSDYRRSGYQRGHLCPSADRSSSSARMRATFIMSNVAPMTAKLNTCSWAQAEEYSRIVARAGHRCFLVAGALIPDSVCHWLHSARIAIPDSFFRACIVTDAPYLSAFWLMANDTLYRSESVCRVPRAHFVRSLRSRVRSIFNMLVSQ